MKDSNEVIQEFNELINMTATELEKWLKSDDSRSAGWPKEGGEGESIGHDSGRQIVEILRSNPKKDPGKYTDEQVQHMRKVVSYCKRHLAQEEKIDNEKSVEELKKTKSYASLKNWGHDILKKRGKTDDAAEDEGGEEDEEEEEEEEDEKQAGDKRKAAGGQAGSKKKQETQKGKSNGADREEEDEVEDDDDELEEVDEDDENDDKADNKKSNSKKSGSQRITRSKDAKNGDTQEDEADEDEEEEADGDDGESKKTAKGPKKGETVSWNWGQGQPEGKVLDVQPEKTTIETKNGNEVSRKGTEEDPAVVLDTGKNKAIKLNHELN